MRQTQSKPRPTQQGFRFTSDDEAIMRELEERNPLLNRSQIIRMAIRKLQASEPEPRRA